MRYDFHWDAAKAQPNLAKHGVPFELALAIFADPLRSRVRKVDFFAVARSVRQTRVFRSADERQSLDVGSMRRLPLAHFTPKI